MSAKHRRIVRTALDLFAGTGNATAVLRSKGWRVVSIDNDPRSSADVVADLAAGLPLSLGPGDVDFLWASPPCNEFSSANPRVDHASKSPDLTLVVAALRIVAAVRPRYWIIENVVGAIPFLGIPARKIGPWCLWGYFPQLRVAFEAQTHRKGRFRSSRQRAAVPRAIARALAVELDRFLDAGEPSLLDMRPFRPPRHKAARRRPSDVGELPLGTAVARATAGAPWPEEEDEE